jgi:hypothetical protein
MERSERLAAVRKESIDYLDYRLDPESDSDTIPLHRPATVNLFFFIHRKVAPQARR